LITLKGINVDNNEKFAVLTVKYFIAPTAEYALNATIEVKKKTSKVLIDFKLIISDGLGDAKCTRELFRATFDLENVFKGRYGAVIFRNIAEGLIKSMGSRPTFPMKAVRMKFIISPQNYSKFRV